MWFLQVFSQKLLGLMTFLLMQNSECLRGQSLERRLAQTRKDRQAHTHSCTSILLRTSLCNVTHIHTPLPPVHRLMLSFPDFLFKSKGLNEVSVEFHKDQLLFLNYLDHSKSDSIWKNEPLFSPSFSNSDFYRVRHNVLCNSWMMFPLLICLLRLFRIKNKISKNSFIKAKNS